MPKTDASLRRERRQTDEELDRRGREEQAETDAAVRTARERADRVRGDQRRQEDFTADPTAQVRADRSRANANVAKGREDADALMAAERVRRQVAVASLLLAERQETDSRLLLERRRADDVLTRRDDFLAMLSHDMRSLLGTVALSAAMLEIRRQHDPSYVARSLATIQRATAQMSRLVADLLDVASLDAGKFILVRDRHDAGHIVGEAADAFRPTASDHGLALSVEVPGDELIVDCDADRIAQVLANLLGNAAKFTQRGGNIALRVERRGSEVCFSVSDTGEGIPPDQQRVIFDRYSQVGRSDARGLGLGLYIAQHIVRAHGGRIWVDSAVGGGARSSSRCLRRSPPDEERHASAWAPSAVASAHARVSVVVAKSS